MTRALLAALLGTALAACSSCPPGWIDAPPHEAGWVYGAAAAGKTYVDARATDLALTRAARVVAAGLELSLPGGLAVSLRGGRPWVEAFDEQGAVHALDDLELVDLVECDGRTYALVRLRVE